MVALMDTATMISERERAADLQALIDAQAHALFDELYLQTQAPVIRKDLAQTAFPERLSAEPG